MAALLIAMVSLLNFQSARLRGYSKPRNCGGKGHFDQRLAVPAVVSAVAAMGRGFDRKRTAPPSTDKSTRWPYPALCETDSKEAQMIKGTAATTVACLKARYRVRIVGTK